MAKPPKDPKADQNKRRDEALKNALRMPPKPHAPEKPQARKKKTPKREASASFGVATFSWLPIRDYLAALKSHSSARRSDSGFFMSAVNQSELQWPPE